jgi:hypothetical protein
VIGNRWGVEYLLLDMRGRDCGSGVVSSHHDRRFIFASGENFLVGPGRGGHGACAAGGVRSVLASTNKALAAYSPKTFAEMAVDGDMSTRWESDFSDPQWLMADMGNDISFTTVELHWQNAHGKVYDIDISNDGQTWTTVYSESNGSGGTDVIDLTGNSGRYIRMYGHERGTQWGYSLFEFNVSGDPLTQLSQPPEMPLVACSGITNQDGNYQT